VGEPLSQRAGEIVAVARELLEQEGADALTMRRLAGQLGIRAPSLYKHFPDKSALEAAIMAIGFEEAALALNAAVDDATDSGEESLAALIAAYRAFALGHPHLYRLMTDRPLPLEHLPAGVQDRAAAPLLVITGSLARARALWAFAHGMVQLELARRLPPDADVEAAWQEGVAAFRLTTTHADESRPDNRR
jgi:AcrR family transcriptional regulator